VIGLKRGTVRLTVHQDEWIDEAENTIKELKKLLGDTAIDIQHIGSTAIPSIHAKPIIDIVIGVRELNDIQPYIEILKEKGFVFRGEDVSGQVLFVKGSFAKDLRTHHIHVVKWNGSKWNNYIDFRDYLNTFPEKALIYNDCKQRLAIQFSSNRKCYTEGKRKLIDTFLEEAKLWRTKQ
jgi:GrpB-like predicted nucleotidyltransferase (UPF0157 family)